MGKKGRGGGGESSQKSVVRLHFYSTTHVQKVCN